MSNVWFARKGNESVGVVKYEPDRDRYVAIFSNGKTFCGYAKHVLKPGEKVTFQAGVGVGILNEGFLYARKIRRVK